MPRVFTALPNDASPAEVLRGLQAATAGDEQTSALSRCWAGLEFGFTAAITPERGRDDEPVEFMPQQGYAKASTSKLNRHGTGPFCQFKIRSAPAEAGVYVITVDDQPVYVGECQILEERFGPRGYASVQPRNCFAGGQSTNCKVNNLILTAAKMNRATVLWFLRSPNRHEVEATLIRTLHPPWNG